MRMMTAVLTTTQYRKALSPTQGSFGPFARPDGEWGISYNNGYVRFPDSADWTLGDTFTLEAFIFPTKLLGYNNIMNHGDWYFTVLANGALQVYGMGGNGDSTSGVVALNTWSHVAFSVSSGTGTFYVNGVARGTTSSNNIGDGSGEFYCGKQGVSNWPFYGVQSNYRVVKGTAVYTSNFTVPTSKLTAITNTKLLTGQSNRFVDNSASGHAAELGGTTPAVSAFGPFLTSSVYNAAVNGASSSPLDNQTYLSIADGSWKTLGTGDFTWEFWFYGKTESTYMIGDSTSSSNISGTFTLGVASKRIILYYSIQGGEAYPLQSPNSAPFYNLNEWHHVAYVRSGNDHKIYANGVLRATATRSGTMIDSTGAQHIGNFGAGYSSGSPTIFSDVRLVKGTAVYSGSTYTVPTAPLTAISNTELLLNFKDAQAIDSAAQNKLTLVGTAKTSTAQKKFGTASLLLDGNSDYATFPQNVANNIDGGTNWTVEFFWRFVNKASPTYQEIITKGNGLQLYTAGGSLAFVLSSNNQSYDIANASGRTTLDNDVWYHLAFGEKWNLLQIIFKWH